VRLKALGTGSTNTWPPPPAERPEPKPRETVGHAVVEARDPRGRPTRLALPGALAGKRATLYVQDARGRPAWCAEVDELGRVVGQLPGPGSEGPRERELARITPGTKITAALDSSGRVLALMATPKN
jgi:hypothetical protein